MYLQKIQTKLKLFSKIRSCNFCRFYVQYIGLVAGTFQKQNRYSSNHFKLGKLVWITSYHINFCISTELSMYRTSLNQFCCNSNAMLN